MAWTPPAEEEKKPTGTSWTPPENEVKKIWTPPAEDDPENPVNEKEPWRLKKLKESGVTLSEEQEKLLWKYEEDRPLLDKAGEAVRTFFPAAAKVANQLGTGSVDLIYKGVLKPIDAMSQTPEEAEKTFKEAGNAWRSFGSGAMSDMEETIDMATRFSMFGSGITDKLQGLPEEERFKRFKNREVMRQFGQAVREEMPDRAAALISENPFLKKAAGAYAKLSGGTPEEVKMAEEAFTELVKESGLTKEELDENISMLGEFMSPVALPGGNRITGAIAKPVGKVVQKTGELALRGIKPIAGAVEGAAELTLKGTELVQGGARKIGEYTTNDPDTLLRTGANTVIMPINAVAKPTSNVARVVKDVTSQVDVGGAAGRRGLFERAGRAETSSDLTRRLFGPQGKGGVARAKVADWTVRQANAIIQPGVNGAALNVLMGLPDIETAAQLGEVAGTGFGIGGFAGARVFDRAGAIIDPTTSLAEKITTVVTPDMAQRRRDEDADIKRFIATATPEMKSQMEDLSNIDKRKTAIDSKLINLRQQKERTINAADEANLQRQIDGFEKQRQALDKATPETVREAERQVQLAFMDAMDLAQATGTSAGLRGLNLTVLNADNAEGFFRNLYGGAVERAEGVVNLLTGRTDLTMQESQNLQQARELLNRFSTEVAGAKNQRGFAIGVDGTDPNADGYVAPHLRKVNQTGATAVINGDLVKHLSEQGFDVRRVINHEMQHALQQFREVKDMLSPIRGDLFDQKVIKDDGTVEVWKQGIFSDADIARYGANYAAKMSPADNGASFIAQFQDVDAFNAYIKDEILAEVASQTGDYSNGTRAALDDVGRNLVDWLEVKTKAGALRKMKEGLRAFGIVFDNYGGFSNVLGADLPPEALAMIRQYQRQLRDFDGSMQIQTTREKNAPDIPMTAILGSRALQEKYKDADFFEKEQILRSTAPDGTVTEIVMPKGAKLDPFVDIYRIQGGQLVDANGNPVQLPPEITFGSLPEGSTFQMDTRIARKPDGSPITLSAREIKSRALERTQSIRNVIDSAPDDGTPNRLIDTGNGNYRGVMSPSQLAAVLSIPNSVLAPALKRQIQFFNELMQRGDGTRAIFEYQAALLNGKYKAIAPKIRDEVPIGWQFTKDGNFALTTISVSRLYDKLQAWADQGTVTQEQTWTGELIPVKRSKNLALWNGDTNKFWNSLVQVLDNHANGREGWVGLHSDELTAKRMRNKVNDLFNVFNKETKEMNPDRSTLPRVRGRDNVDIIVRSRRVDRINSFSESPSTKVPVNYGKLLINYMPETTPLAAPQTPEQFMENINGSVSATRIRNAIATGAVDQLEAELRNSDDLLPTESLFVSQGEGGDPLIQVTSMLDPNVEGALEPEEVVVDLDARTAEELARLEAAEQTAAAEQQAALDAQQAQATAEQQTNQELELAIEAEARDNERYRTSLEERIRSGVAFSNAVVAPAGIQFLPAFHGSPHDFDKFSIGKIGTGEGQQAFGYGLYFAGAKAVGEGYRAKLARDIRVDGVAAPNEEIIKNQQINDLLGILTDALKVRKSGMMPDRKNIDRAIRMLEDEKEASVDNTYAEEILNWWFDSGSKGLKDPSKIQYGTLYKVELDVDDSNLLDWDKPLSEQSKTVQEAVLPTIVSELDKIQKARQAIVQRGTRLGGLPFRPGELEKLQKPMPDPLSLTGRAAYVYVTNTFGGRPYEDSPKASDFLLSRGIAGIRYFDAMSRGAGEGTHNYVIFDDKLITVLEKNDKPVGPVIQFMPAEAPSGERGFQSKLQLEIQKKFKGASATPEQLKAVLGNPQNVKPEEVKWSGVMDEIDRLAQENNGKVPVQELLNYLRNEGQVKFEEVTLGGTNAKWKVSDSQNTEYFNSYEEAQEAREEWINNALDYYDLPYAYTAAENWTIEETYRGYVIEDDFGNYSGEFTDREEAEDYLNEWKQKWYLDRSPSQKTRIYDHPFDGGYDSEEDAIDSAKNNAIEDIGSDITIEEDDSSETNFSSLVLPGGENYSEVVLSMPPEKVDYTKQMNWIIPNREEIIVGRESLNWKDAINKYIGGTEGDVLIKTLDKLTSAERETYIMRELVPDIRIILGATQNTYVPFKSSHFPNVPNYIAHMRVNERTDAEGNPGLFVEEFQSDRHQQGREKGYNEDLDVKRREELQNKQGSLTDAEMQELGELNSKQLGQGIPDAPFRKDWGVQLFKRALRDAVESGKTWIGWTTGIEQVKRYENAMRQAVDEIEWTTPAGKPKAFGAIKNGKTVLAGKINDDGTIYDSGALDANGKQLSEVVGKNIATKILSENSGTATGDDLTVGGEGMKGFYDQILPKEIGKYVSKMGGKVEKSEIETGESKFPSWDKWHMQTYGQEVDATLDDAIINARYAEWEKLRDTPQTAPIWRVNITPEMENVVRAGQIQFMPAEQGPLADIQAPEQRGEKAALEGIQIPVEKPKEITPEQSVFISEKALRKFDSLGDKNATQVNADNMRYPVNSNPYSVALPGRWGLVSAKITGMPKTFKEVSEIIDRQVNRLVRLVNANPEFAKESARFYRDMAESATMITDAAFPQAQGKEKYLFDELVLRFLALGSPRTSVAANASKSAGSVAALIDEFEAGYKIGFGEQSHGAKTTFNAWKKGGHFDLSLPGVQDKVRSFYLNSLAELIEMAEAKNDSASVEELMVRAGKSMRVLDPNHSSKLTDNERKEIQRLLDGKATIDMWDMAAKGWAWPGYIIFKKRRNSAKQPFQWSQDDFEKTGTLADKNWKQVQSELGIESPSDLRYQQARALKIDGNQDWTLETWNERKVQPFPESTKFSYYTQGTEAGLSPGGGGPLYDAQQAIDGLLADRLNELGLATLFGKTKLKARNAQEILWALEKLDNPIEANNDLSLFGNTFEPFLTEVLKLRQGKDIDPKSRAENVLAAMDRAYAAMAQQLIPIEVVSGGTSEEAKRIQDAIKNLQDAGDPNAATTLTLHVADGLGKAINDLAIKHGIKATIENVDVGEGGYTENQQVNVAPNIRVTLRGKPEETFLVLETLSRAMDQDGGNVIRKPTMRELNDIRVKKNLILTIPTTGLDQAQRNKMFLDLAALKDANGDSFLTGFTEVDGGIAIGNQFYSGDYEKAIIDNKTNIDGILKNYGLSLNQSAPVTSAIIQTFYRGQASTKIEPEKIMVKKKEVLRPSFASDLYDYIKNRMTNIPLAGSRPSFAQRTDFEKNWIDKANALFSKLNAYPINSKSEKEKAKLEAPDIASNTKRTAALVALKSELETALLRDQISEDVANRLKAQYGFKEEKQSKEEE